MKPALMLARQEHAGRQVVFAGLHQPDEFGPARARLPGDPAPGFAGMSAIGPAFDARKIAATTAYRPRDRRARCASNAPGSLAS